MNEVLNNLKAGVDLLDGYHTAVLILPNHVVICNFLQKVHIFSHISKSILGRKVYNISI